MRNDRGDAHRAVALIHCDGFDGGVGDDDLFQLLRRANGRRVRIDRFEKEIRGLRKGTGEWSEEQNQRSLDVGLHGETRFRRKGTWTKSTPQRETRSARRTIQKSRWFLARAVPIHNELGDIHRWCGTSTDIHHTATIERVARPRPLAASFSDRLARSFRAIPGANRIERRGHRRVSHCCRGLEAPRYIQRASLRLRPHSTRAEPVEKLARSKNGRDGGGITAEGRKRWISWRACATPSSRP